MNIQVMNVAASVIEQRISPLANWLTRSNHVTALRDGFLVSHAVCDRRKLTGSLYFSAIYHRLLPARFGQFYLTLKPLLSPTFELTIGLIALIVAFGASASLAKQYQLPERLSGLTGCLAFLLFIGFSGNEMPNVYLGGMGIFTALISSTYAIEIIRFFYKRGWYIKLPDEVPLMTRNGFQLIVPLMVILLSISMINAYLQVHTGLILPELIASALQPLIVASDTLTAVLVSLLICHLLWFIGIHGALNYHRDHEPVLDNLSG